MELGVKAIVGGAALFVLGGISVYLLTSAPSNAVPPESASETVLTTSSAPTVEINNSATNAESFYAAAEARREQQLIEKSEADRLTKLRKIKENSTECKFWKQQNKTSKAAAKIEEKITQYCTLPISSESSSSASSGEGTTNGAG